MSGSTKLVFIALVLLALPVRAEDVVGQVGYMSGSLLAKRTDGTMRVLAQKSAVQEGDVLVTSSNGYAQVRMTDGAQLTLRPDSTLKIENYHFKKEAPQSDSALIRLVKGGFRTLSGLIGKRGNPDAYELRAATATIGIRGTDFTTRICEGMECQREPEGRTARQETTPVLVAGRVMLLEGAMTAADGAGKSRKLLLGAPVYEGDTLNTDDKSNAVVAFRDGGRITLQANSKFFIEKYKYDKTASQEGAILRLLKGGVRVVTGLIGHVKHEDYQFRVATSTIGIRGTGFDAWCNGGCASGGANSGGTPDKPLDGAGVYVWAGAIVFTSPQGSIDVALQQAAIISSSTGKPVPLVVVPKSILENNAPRPDSVPVDMHKEFDTESNTGAAGVYVTVHDGQVIISQNNVSLNLGSGENAFANGAQLLRLLTTPQFMNSGDIGTINTINPNPSVNPVGCVVK